MERKQWEKAEPYAEEAAKSGAGWAMLTAGACQEGLKNWDAAEEHVRNAATTYSDGKVTWYCFCRRTGHGDLDSARQMASEFIDNFDPSDGDSSAADAYETYVGLYYILEKQFDRAIQYYEGDFAKKNNPYSGLRLALLADRLKDAKSATPPCSRSRKRALPTCVKRRANRAWNWSPWPTSWHKTWPAAARAKST